MQSGGADQRDLGGWHRCRGGGYWRSVFDVVATATVPYPAGVREAILSVSNAATHTATIARLNFLLGELFAEALGSTGVPLDTIELIGSHGQTIFHEGEPVEFLGRKVASTMQIGEAAVIAERTGIETIADFRPSDMAAGGKGAPLVPFLDYQLFRHPEFVANRAEHRRHREHHRDSSQCKAGRRHRVRHRSREHADGCCGAAIRSRRRACPRGPSERRAAGKIAGRSVLSACPAEVVRARTVWRRNSFAAPASILPPPRN